MQTSRLLRSLGTIWFGLVTASGLGFLARILFARNLGVEGYGQLATALAVVTILAPVAVFGVGQHFSSLVQS